MAIDRFWSMHSVLDAYVFCILGCLPVVAYLFWMWLAPPLMAMMWSPGAPLESPSTGVAGAVVLSKLCICMWDACVRNMLVVSPAPNVVCPSVCKICSFLSKGDLSPAPWKEIPDWIEPDAARQTGDWCDASKSSQGIGT